MKATSLQNNDQTKIISSNPDVTPEECKENRKHIYIIIIIQYFCCRKNNIVTDTTPITFTHQNKHDHNVIYAYKTGTTHSQQITTFAKLPT